MVERMNVGYCDKLFTNIEAQGVEREHRENENPWFSGLSYYLLKKCTCLVAS